MSAWAGPQKKLKSAYSTAVQRLDSTAVQRLLDSSSAFALDSTAVQRLLSHEGMRDGAFETYTALGDLLQSFKV